MTRSRKLRPKKTIKMEEKETIEFDLRSKITLQMQKI